MFCENCGNKLEKDDLFCKSCGNKLNRNEIKKVRPKKTNPGRSLATKITFIILGVCSLFVIGLIAFILIILNSFETKSYITMGKDQIPTIYGAVGKRNVTSFSAEFDSTSSFKKVTYSIDEFEEDDMDEINEFLLLEGYELVINLNSTYTYLKESNEIGKVLLITIDYTDNDIIVNYIKKDGSIYDYEKFDMDDSIFNSETIGLEEVGYLTTNSQFKEYNTYYDVLTYITYSDKEENNFITFAYYDEKYTIDDYLEYYEEEKDLGNLTYKVSKEVLAGIEMTVVLAEDYDGLLTKEYAFINEAGYLCYISMQSYIDDSIFSLIKTYKSR